jgi:uncharacterized membrane protein required for colicin V production
VFDVVTLAVGAVGYALGRSRGLVWQASGLLTLVGGGLCATVLSRPLGRQFADGVAGRFVAWVVVYAVVAVCLYVLTLKFKNRIKELEYDELDRRFGGMVGVVKALAVFGLVTLVAAAVAPRLAERVKASISGQALRAVVHEARAALPDQIHDAFGPWLDAVDGPPPAAPSSTRWPETEPPVTTERRLAAPPPAPPTEPSTAPAPTPAAREAGPARRVVPPVEGDDLRPPPPPPRPVVEPVDPFDTSRDPPDPLAPPR